MTEGTCNVVGCDTPPTRPDTYWCDDPQHIEAVLVKCRWALDAVTRALLTKAALVKAEREAAARAA